MNLLDSIFSRFTRPAVAPAGRAKGPASSLPATNLAAGPDSQGSQLSRRNLLRIALREVKARLGIPAEWLQMHAMVAASPRRGSGIHACLVVQHWHPLLMRHAPSIEQMLVQQTILIDPLAVDWLIAVSWKFELAADLDLGPLPPTSAWADPEPHYGEPVALAGFRTVARQAHPSRAAAHEMGVIAGPVLIPGAVPSALDLINAEMAAGDRQRRVTTGMEPTEPAKLS